MSATQFLFDGAQRAAQLVPLLFALNAVQPAAAQLPRLQPAAAPAAASAAVPAVSLDTVAESSPLTLAAQHVDVRIIGDVARVRSTLVWRNDGSVPVPARWQVPATMQVVVGAPVDGEGCGGLGDDNSEAELDAQIGQATQAAADDALAREQLEAGEVIGQRPGQTGEVMLQPGEEVTITIQRELDLLVRGDRHRLVLPLTTQRHAVFTQQFSAQVTVDAARPIVDFGSVTHAAEVSGVGDTQAQLVIANGRVYEGQFLAVEFMLGGAAPAPAVPTPVATLAAWGGEVRVRR